MTTNTKAILIGSAFGAKAINPESVPGWRELVGSGAQTATAPADAYRLALVFRCIALRANAISSLPFKILRGETEQEGWPLTNKFPRLLWDIEAALCLWGVAYVLKLANPVLVKDLQWLNPTSIRVVRKPGGPITGFEQWVGSQKRQFKREEVVYFRSFNPTDDLGPGIAPVMAADLAVALMRNTDIWASKFFENGAVPATILTTEQNLSQPEVERISAWWKRAFQGVRNAFKTAILWSGLKVEVVGNRVKDMALPEIREGARRDIALAFGIPVTLLEDAANYATAKEHRLSFYTETIFPEARLIESAFNEQLFIPAGLEFRFDYRSVEAVQQDEATKAEGLRGLVEAGILTKDEARAELGYGPLPGEKSEPTAGPIAEQPNESIAAMRADMSRWREKARKRGKAVSFESSVIPSSWHRVISERMRGDMTKAFDFLAEVKDARAKHEADLQNSIQSVFSQKQREYARQIAAGEAIDYEELGETLRGAITTHLIAIGTEEFLRQAVTLGVQFDPAVVNAAAQAWARAYSYDLVSGLVETTRAVVQGAIEQFISTPGMTRAELEALLAPAFGEARASMIAVTEVTRAYSEATNRYQEILRESGIEMIRVWRTREDELVCPICGPLADQPEDRWGDLKGGPPAHVNCRCFSVLQAVRRRHG